MKKDDLLTTTKECVEYTISMFASDPSGFVQDDEEHTVNDIDSRIIRQYYQFKEMTNKLDIDFKECMTIWNRGEELYSKLS